jgi:hypothetical protein
MIGPHGDYNFRNVANGTYEVTVTLAGFSPASAAEVIWRHDPYRALTVSRRTADKQGAR